MCVPTSSYLSTIFPNIPTKMTLTYSTHMHWLPPSLAQFWSWIPIPTSEGTTIGGLLNNTIETTAKVVAARRLRTIRELCEKSMLTSSANGFVNCLVEVLEPQRAQLERRSWAF